MSTLEHLRVNRASEYVQIDLPPVNLADFVKQSGQFSIAPKTGSEVAHCALFACQAASEVNGVSSSIVVVLSKKGSTQMDLGPSSRAPGFHSDQA